VQCTRNITLGIKLLELLLFVFNYILEFLPENFLQICNLFWTVTLTFFKLGVKVAVSSGALVTFCDKALVIIMVLKAFRSLDYEMLQMLV